MAPLLPPRHAPLRASLLLVLRLLPLPLPPPPPHILHHSSPPKAHVLHALQPVHSHLHVLPLAGVFSIFPSPGDTANHSALLRGLWVSVLDRHRAAQSSLPVCGELPGCFARVQLGLPYWGPFSALVERWVQWHWCLGLQFCLEWSNFVVVLEVLCEEDAFQKHQSQ
ncbi:hypothetical protein F2P56_012558 [Juglans regia]|uniref:Uncharacterized protein n=1 Tax=Juglans regia TaxID=51240 RepID=A0A833XNJ8_JUGRE|nr:hypothetical protein F2P56_012558 [Juglans regia]